MTALRDFQRTVIRALLASGGDPPADTFDVGNISAVAGFAVHRNTVFAGLTAALGDLYPVVRQLVGDGFFAFAAHEYVQAHPPASPVLTEYGDTFPAFIDGFEPARQLPYLGDVARLELTRHHVLNAADAEPIEPQAFVDVPKPHLGELRLTLHPSIALFRSDFPVHAIWEAHQVDSGINESLELPDRGARLLIGRPHDTVETLALADDAFAFVARLAAGTTLSDAFAGAASDDPEEAWNVEATLTALLAFGAFTAFNLSGDTT